jgi:DNA-binding protein H-NS
LTAEDVFPPARARSSANAGAKVAPKYRDPATGQTWTGRGKPPKWIADQDREKFAI